MTAHDLTDLLERVAERTAVGPPPLARMRDGVRRRRRRRAVLGGVGLSATVVAGTLLVPVLTNPGHDGRSPRPATTQTPPVVSPPAPEVRLRGTYRIVGMRSDTSGGLSYYRARIHFAPGHIRGSDGCNTISGTYRRQGDRLRVDRDLRTTARACFPPAPPVFDALLEARRVARDQGGTYLLGADGHVVIALVRR
jgi:heat shock protein HslJ